MPDYKVYIDRLLIVSKNECHYSLEFSIHLASLSPQLFQASRVLKAFSRFKTNNSHSIQMCAFMGAVQRRSSPFYWTPQTVWLYSRKSTSHIFHVDKFYRFRFLKGCQPILSPQRLAHAGSVSFSMMRTMLESFGLLDAPDSNQCHDPWVFSIPSTTVCSEICHVCPSSMLHTFVFRPGFLRLLILRHTIEIPGCKYELLATTDLKFKIKT